MLISCFHENMIGMWLQKTYKKYGAPTAHASYFFLKKNRSLFTSTSINTNKKKKRIKKYFSTCLLFLALTIITIQ